MEKLKQYKLSEYYSLVQANTGLRAATEEGWQVESVDRDARGYFILYSQVCNNQPEHDHK